MKPLSGDRLSRALRKEITDCTPVWFMRQAGRSLPRYRETRAERAMFDLLRDHAAAAEITALPLDYFPVDAAVLYNDIVTPFFAAGLHVELRPGVGPVVTQPIRGPGDVERLAPFDARTALAFTLDQIRILRQRLDVPVLGFIGAPYTLSSYLFEGRTRDLAQIKAFMYREPEAWHRLAHYWSDHLAEYAIAQHEAGAAAIQVFDSWAGTLSMEDYARLVLPHSRHIFERLGAARVPSIHFATGNPALLPLIAEAGGDCISVDWRMPIDEAWSLIGEERAIQGNLDPVVLLAGEAAALAKTREILDRVRGRPGHIFNVGHGLLPETDPDVVRAVVEFVHSYTAEG
jgi:uroporphyrinogen decarboxylase